MTDYSGEVAQALAVAYTDPKRQWSVATRQFARKLIEALAEQGLAIVERDFAMSEPKVELEEGPPCTCPERPCPRASVFNGGQRTATGWAAQLEEPRYTTFKKMG